jgi:hypothetical protein
VAIPTQWKEESRMERNTLKRRRRERMYIQWRYNARYEVDINEMKKRRTARQNEKDEI